MRGRVGGVAIQGMILIADGENRPGRRGALRMAREGVEKDVSQIQFVANSRPLPKPPIGMFTHRGWRILLNRYKKDVGSQVV
ncbi:hypothetical protein FHW96_003994 [Novosphingobium sp. SG751A]|nr:hypothetical protein [Novosphingobium sp. SG751A]